jgi:cation diffusion facilitator CzcD-associated flavoprotein CzcO
MQTPIIGIIGAGPIGLEAALYARRRGFQVKLFEAGRVGEHLSQWGHIPLFTPWSMNTSSWAKETLSLPDSPGRCPTGREMVELFLRPLASHEALAGVVQENTRVIQVGRETKLKSEMDGRGKHPFTLLLSGPNGERWESCDVLIDASGVYGNPNPIGRDGLLAPGERQNQDFMVFGLPNLQAESHRVSGKDVVVVGSGMSAATSIVAVAGMRPSSVTWLTRRPGSPLELIPNDPLPEREKLIKTANHMITSGGDAPAKVRHIPGARILEVQRSENFVKLILEGHQAPIKADTILANTGFRPNWNPTRELQVHHCYATEGPMKLAAALMGSEGGDCMTQISHGPESLASPEPMFFAAGHKSYGRRSDFLLQLGHQQIMDIFDLIPSPVATRG